MKPIYSDCADVTLTLTDTSHRGLFFERFFEYGNNCFITSKEIEDNRNVAGTIISNRNLDDDHHRKKEVDPANIKEIKDSVIHILDWLVKKGIPKEKIVVDITGGTAVMSCGAFDAAKEYGIDMQYVYSDYDFKLNKVLPDTQKALIVKG